MRWVELAAAARSATAARGTAVAASVAPPASLVWACQLTTASSARRHAAAYAALPAHRVPSVPSPQVLAAAAELAELQGGAATTDADSLSATWQLVWTTEKETLFILENARWFGTAAGEVYQVGMRTAGWAPDGNRQHAICTACRAAARGTPRRRCLMPTCAAFSANRTLATSPCVQVIDVAEQYLQNVITFPLGEPAAPCAWGRGPVHAGPRAAAGSTLLLRRSCTSVLPAPPPSAPVCNTPRNLCTLFAQRPCRGSIHR